MIKELEVAKNVKDAVKLIKQGYLPYAGGTEITRLGSFVKGEKFVSLKNCALDTIEEIGDEIKIGAMCTFTDLIKSPIIPDALKKALHFCSSLQKRNMATIGGNIQMHRDDSYLIPTLIAYDSEIESSYGKGRHPMFILDDIDLKREFITYIYIKKNRTVVSDRIANTQASHALITASSGGVSKDEFVISAAIKDTAIISMLGDPSTYATFQDGITFKSDVLYGSKEYKKYITATVIEGLVKEYEKKIGGNK